MSRCVQKLVGRTVKRVVMNAERTRLGLELENDDRVVYRTAGDCCSESWIEHFEVEDLLGGEITGVEIPSWCGPEEVDESDDRGEVVKVYGVRFLVRGRGVCALEFRNASNGYYGGSIEQEKDDSGWPHLNDVTRDF